MVDDEPLVNKIHTLLFKSANADQHLTAFTDPLLGIEHIRKQPLNKLVLLDINMPNMDAWSFLSELEKLDIFTDVVILSSSINPEDRMKASLYRNIKAFLHKPISKLNIARLSNLTNKPIEWTSLES